MASDPSAPDLGASRARLKQPTMLGTDELADLMQEHPLVMVRGADLRALLAAYDAQAARLAAQQPVVDAVLKLSTYSRETVDEGVRRIVEASDEYEEWLLEHPDAH